MLAIMGINIGRQEALDRTRKLAVEPVNKNGFEDRTETEPDEFRGPTIVGGDERRIGKGDFVRIPAGVPHWISKIEGTEIIYLVVKTLQ